MIIDFTITNFRSFKEEQVFSLYAEDLSKHLEENIAHPASEKNGSGNYGILKSSGIYGANASGKSNLLRAFKALQYIICYSGDLKDGEQIPCYEPYLLDPDTALLPTKLEVEFVCDELRYIYKVSFDANRIINESLDYYPSRSKARLYLRESVSSWEDVTFGGYYKGGRKKIAFFDNNSYLSKAGNTADAPEQIQKIYNYFRKDIFALDCNRAIIGFNKWKKQQQAVSEISSILANIDTGISSVEFRQTEFDEAMIPKNIPDNMRRNIIESESIKPVFTHSTSDGLDVEFSEEMESEGTSRLFNLMPLIINTLRSGGILLLDELESSFHPHIAELIVKLFNDPQVNIKNSQLIFTTHNTNLMKSDSLRRDQIWLVEKDKGETKLVSLDEFDKSSLKVNSPFSKWYDDGRLGGIPSVNYAAIAKAVRGE